MLRTVRAKDVKPGDSLSGALGGTLRVREALVVDPTRVMLRVTDSHGNNFQYGIHPERFVDLEVADEVR